MKSQIYSTRIIVRNYIKDLGEYSISAGLYKLALEKEPNNVDVAIDLSNIYSTRMDKKQESVDILNKCLNNVTEERDKAKIQAKLNKIIEHFTEQENDDLLIDGIEGIHTENEENFFEI